MMRFYATTLIVALTSLMASPALARVGEFKERGLQSGKEFQFNMVGHPKDYHIPSCDNNGRRVFVPRGGNTKIEVYVGEGGYDILCATNSDTSHRYKIETPQPSTFDVYVRMLGKPGGTLSICTDILDDPDSYGECLVGTVDLSRGSGKSNFSIQTSKLFADDNEDVLWSVTTNNDFRIAQFRFYEKGTSPN